MKIDGWYFTPMAVELFDPTFYCLGLVTMGRIRSHVKQWSREGGVFLQSFCLFRLVKSSLDSKDYQNWQIMEWEHMIGLDSQGSCQYFFFAGFLVKDFKGMGLQGFYQPGFQGMGVVVNKSFKDTPRKFFPANLPWRMGCLEDDPSASFWDGKFSASRE